MNKKIEAVIKEAGAYVRNVDYSYMDMKQKKNFRDICTEHDEKTQAFIYEELSKIIPDAKFIGEESSENASDLRGYCFIVDPIDGTLNFSLDFHHSAISIALAKDGEVVLGMVYDPYLDELFHAEKGKGAYVNGKRIYARETDLAHTLLGFGTSPYYMDHARATFALIESIYPNVMDIRRCGSAALDICYVASNRQNAFFEMILSPWDYAAAGLVLKEAGGVITDMQGEELNILKPCSVICGNTTAYSEIMKYIKK